MWMEAHVKWGLVPDISGVRKLNTILLGTTPVKEKEFANRESDRRSAETWDIAAHGCFDRVLKHKCRGLSLGQKNYQLNGMGEGELALSKKMVGGRCDGVCGMVATGLSLAGVILGPSAWGPWLLDVSDVLGFVGNPDLVTALGGVGVG